MTVAVTGSIAVDHLMRFPGRFAEQLVPEALDKVSLSFLADDLKVRDGGVAANIAFGMAQLGLRPKLVGAVGHDFAGYRDRLEAYGVDCAWVHTSQTRHTARFVCTTDIDMCQIATFYTGAMAESVDIDLARLLATMPSALVIIGADTPAAMLRHARACRRYPVVVAADPSQQLARMSAAEILEFIDGADYVLANEYEQALLESKTGLTMVDLLDRIGYLVTTLGAGGVRLRRHNGVDIHVPAVPTSAALDPTGVGDGFRAGFFSALRWGLSLTDAARVGCVLAVVVLEAPGPQEYAVRRRPFRDRLAVAYGADVASRVGEAWPARPTVAHR